MKQLFCEYHYCDEPLKTGDEIVTGLCGRHLDCILSKKYFVGICWQCGSITMIQSHQEQKNYPISEKYIFAKGCVKCTGDTQNGISWMTIKRSTPPSSAVTAEGTIVPYQVQSTVTKVNFDSQLQSQ